MVTTPSAPSPTTTPGNTSGSPARDQLRSSPSAVTSSSPETDVDRQPCRSPDPCVAVATAPATEMCGSEARLGTAKPAASSVAAMSPYRLAALTRAVARALSISRTGGSAERSTWSPSVSAMSLKQCRVPSAFSRVDDATSDWSSATDVGRWRRAAR